MFTSTLSNPAHLNAIIPTPQKFFNRSRTSDDKSSFTNAQTTSNPFAKSTVSAVNLGLRNVTAQLDDESAFSRMSRSYACVEKTTTFVAFLSPERANDTTRPPRRRRRFPAKCRATHLLCIESPEYLASILSGKDQNIKEKRCLFPFFFYEKNPKR